MGLLSNTLYDDRYISSLSLMELIQGALNKNELSVIKKFIKETFSMIIHPDEDISRKSVFLLEKHALSDGLRTIDALIAASALIKNATLATANFRHFQCIPNLNILKFIPSES